MAFLNPVLLGFMALGSVPIIIHLLNKRRFRPIQWAAMEFLLKALKQNSRRLQIRDLILMAIRTLAVLALVMALSRPTLSGHLSLPGARSQTGAVILLDNSFSMAYHNGRETRFDVAKRLVKTILAQLDKGAWCALYTFNEDSDNPLGDPSPNLAYIEQELDRFVFLSDGATHVDKAFKQTKKLFETHSEFKAASKEIYVVTDMQARAWNSKHVSADFGKLLQELTAESSIFLVDVGDAAAENAGILNIEPSDTLVTVDMSVKFAVKIKNFGNADIGGLAVDFFVDAAKGGDERPVERQLVDIPSGEVTSVTFETLFQTGGDHKVEVRLADDRLAADNRRFCTVEVVDETHFLLVDGRDMRDNDPRTSETGYLQFALAPKDPEDPEAKTVVVCERVPHYRLGEKNLANYQALVLCNVDKLNPAAVQVIQRQVFSGMGLLIFLGDQTDPTYYNQTFGEAAAKLLPAEIGETWGTVPEIGADLPPSRSLANDADRVSHPIMAAFADALIKPMLAQIKVYKAFELKPAQSEDVQAVAFLDDGRPLAVERKVGTGGVLLFGVPATTMWSNLPTQPVFPITMFRAAQRLTQGNRPAKNLPVATPIRGYVSLADQKTKVKIVAPPPVGERETLPEPTGDGRAAFDYPDTDRAGFYEVTLDRAGFTPRVYSLNANAEVESDLSTVLAESLKQEYPGFDFTYVAKNEDLKNKLISEKHGTEIWPWFMTLVFLLLATESILAHLWAPRD
ncbi:MAG: BatA domain-containing protein [Planctomycetota bacterium]|nr:BatA domain-containing protein [Planctomycetota bacterium]